MNDGHLSTLLFRASRLTLGLEVARAILCGSGLFVAAGLLALAIDAVLALPTWGLVAVDVLLVLLLAALAAFAAWQAWRNLFDPRRAARLIERHLGIRDNRLINAVDLAAAQSARQPGPQPGSVSSELISKSLDEGEELAAGLSSTHCVDFKRLARPAGIAAGMLLLVLVSYVVAPQAFGMILPRLLDPAGDHPPYSLLNFDVKVEPHTIYYGRGATITVDLSGPQMPSQADLVFLLKEGKQRSPMFRSGDCRFVLPIEHAESSCEFYVDTPAGRSRRIPLHVLSVPAIEKVKVAYSFPDYTKWPPYEQVLDSRGIQALERTNISVTVGSNIPLRFGRLELFHLKPGEEQPLETLVVQLSPQASDVTIVSATFPLSFSGRFRLSLTAANGAESLESLEGTLVAVPDRAPRVAIVQPAPHLVVVENWKVPVVIQAADDVAIARIRLLRSINGWGPSPTDLEFDLKQPTIAVANSEFDLKELGARAGDVITYFASAYDNRPPHGQAVDTDTYVIQVISEEEYIELARRDYQMAELEREFDAMRRRLDNLQSEREKILKELEQLRKKLDAGEKPSAEDLEQLARLEKQMQEYQKQADQLAQAMRERAEQTQLYDLEKPYQEMLQRLSQQLDRQAHNAGQVAERLSKFRQQPESSDEAASLREAADEFARENAPFDRETLDELQQTKEDLEKIRKADELLAQAERLRSITLKQRDVADRLAQFRDQEQLSGDDRQRAERLAMDQELLQQELEETTQALEKAAEAASADLPIMSESALQLCHELKEMRVPDDQSTAARQARQGSGDKAHAASETAATKLESLLSKLCNCEGAGEELAGKIDGPLKLSLPGMQNSLKQLSQGRRMPGLPQSGQSQGQAQSGSGLAGSRARMVVVGPHTPSAGDSDAVQSGMLPGEGRGRGPGLNSASDGKTSPETLTPAAGSNRAVSGQNMRGVPVGYRDQAEAYFKRLAEDK